MIKKKSSKKKVAKLLPVYSGPKSEEFWNRVNSLPERASLSKSDLYTAGVLLQEMESRILGWLWQAEVEAIGKERTFK